MAHYLTYAGLSGFLLVFGWTFATDQPLGQCLVHGLVAMFLFALATRWWLRFVFGELHHALYERQMAAEYAATTAAAEATTAAAEAADAAVGAAGGAAFLAAQEEAGEEEAPAPLSEAA